METHLTKHCSKSAFTLIDSVVAVGVSSVALMALYAGISSGFQMAEVARENLRATQIVVERLETVRLYTFDQLTNSTFLPPRFTNWYSFHNEAGFPYVGTITVEDWVPAQTPNYLNDVRVVTVEVKWKSSGQSRTRSMQTLVARDGLQDYVY